MAKRKERNEIKRGVCDKEKTEEYCFRFLGWRSLTPQIAGIIRCYFH